MNKFFKKLKTKPIVSRKMWDMHLRNVIAVVAVAVIGGVVTLLKVSPAPVMVSVFSCPITDKALLDRIVIRIEQEGVRSSVTPTGVVQVFDEKTAKHMRAILLREDLVPSEIDPWQVFDKERWTITYMERSVNFQCAQQKMVTEQIKAISGVDDVSLTIVWPKEEFFLSDQAPPRANVVITHKPKSGITRNYKKIEVIQILLQNAVEGLQTEHIIITDQNGDPLDTSFL